MFNFFLIYIRDNVYGLKKKSVGMEIRMWRTYYKMFSGELTGVFRFGNLQIYNFL